MSLRNHRMPLKVDENQGNPLLIRQLCEGLPDHHGGVVVGDQSGWLLVIGLGRARQRNRALSLAPAQAVDARVYDNAVQPGGHG